MSRVKGASILLGAPVMNVGGMARGPKAKS